LVTDQLRILHGHPNLSTTCRTVDQRLGRPVTPPAGRRRVLADLDIGVVFLGLHGGSVQAQLHRGRQRCAVQRGLGQEAGAQAVRGGEILRQAGQPQPVAQDGPQRIRGQAAGQGAVGLADRAEQGPFGPPS
jgi:hypothetical protein